MIVGRIGELTFVTRELISVERDGYYDVGFAQLYRSVHK